jgi:hypothetical protein
MFVGHLCWFFTQSSVASNVAPAKRTILGMTQMEVLLILDQVSKID